MDSPNEKAKAYLSIAIDTYIEEVMPVLPKERRYAGAMIASALGVARRRLEYDDPAERLVEKLTASDMKTLAKSIRSGAVSGTTHENLASTLMNYVNQELAITNPKFLERRKSK